MRHLLIGILLLTALGTAPSAAAQTPPAPSAAHVKIYEDFRYWLTKQPPDSPAPLDRYRQELKVQGVGVTLETRRERLAKVCHRR